MGNKSIFCNYALLGEDLDLKQNVNLEIDSSGKIIEISYENTSKQLEVAPNSHSSLLIPGFINSHVHIGDNFAKELGFNKELKDIVAPPFGLKHKLLRQTPDETKIKGIQNAVLEMLSNGITFFIDFREEGVEGVKILKNALSDNTINYLTLGRFMDETEIDSVFDLADGVGLSSYKEINSSNKKLIISAKEKFKKLIACHCAENIRNINRIKEMFEDNFVDIIIHGTKFIRDDLKNLKKKKKSLVLCPRCNGYFGTGFPPINELLSLNIPMSLGTDNLMVNNTDLLEEIRYFYRISRVLCSFNKELQLTSKDLMQMITINAAKTFRLEKEFGSISEGKYADFFFIDLCDPNLFVSKIGSNNILDLLTQRLKSENIKKTYIKGELAFERN
ncbi:MAG: amidohydrolase family protein [Candidatus Hermodarchaeota archaeon]